MQKRSHKKRQTKTLRARGVLAKMGQDVFQGRKPVPVANRVSYISWGWMPAMLVVVICGLMLLVFAISRSQTSTGDSMLPPTVTAINTPTPMKGATPDARQTTGVFPLSSGGPIPVPANVLHPTNIARVVVNNVLMSIYAGSMTRSPALGAVAILQENLTSGQQSLHLYQTAQSVGPLTILAVHNDMLTLSTAKAKGTFNLGTDQFHF